jgi:hypothetical protein
VFEVAAKPEDCLKWLQVSEYKQEGKGEWQPTPNCFMQFDQHGPLLHEQK